MYLMEPYDYALRQILETGVKRTNKRTGEQTLAVFGIQSRYRLDQNYYFPILTKRKVWPKSIFAELLWFISGSTNNKDLQKLGSNIWTPWVSKEFEEKHHFIEESLGPVYGFQCRHFDGYFAAGDAQGLNYGLYGVDQLQYVINRIKEDPSCRRILFSLWNPKQLGKMRLAPCHILYQVFIDDDGNLSGMMYQRSCDFPIGVPANIQFYSALTCMIAQQTGYKPVEFIHITADSHIYFSQIEAVQEYLQLPIIDSPKLKIHKAPDIFSYKMEDFELIDFKSGPKLNIPVAV